jgi:hypothetical protein
VECPRPSGCEVLPAEDGRFEQRGTPYVLREDRDALVAYHHEETQGAVVDRCVLHVLLPDRHGFAGLAGALCPRDRGPALAAGTPAAGADFRGAGGPLLTDPGSSLVPANPVAPGAASGDVWGAPWHAAERPWGGTEALDRLFADSGLAPADRGG